MLQNNPELKGKIDQLWNKFWSGGISNPLTAIEQITYLLFMKRLDELDLKSRPMQARGQGVCGVHSVLMSHIFQSTTLVGEVRLARHHAAAPAYRSL